MSGPAAAQEQPAAPEQKPQVRIHYLNVCTPPEADQQVLRQALGALPQRLQFAPDFEVSRGRTTMEQAAASRFVRVRRDFPADSPFLTAQYSVSDDDNKIIETLVLRWRDPKEILQVSIEDQVAAAAGSPTAVISTDTPASRIKVERFGKESVALTRCPAADQSAYEPLFQQASRVLARYRAGMGLRGQFRGDLAWVGGGKPAGKRQPKAPAAKSKAPDGKP